MPAGPGVAVSAERLGKTWRSGGTEVEAVRSISFVVERGEIFVLLGPNGAGKSTTIQMLVTLVKPTTGTARIAGYDVLTEGPRVRRSIGVALQETGLDPLLTAAELLELHAALLGASGRAARERATVLLDRVGLTHAAGRRIGTYSGGMRRQLDLALALVADAPVVILDEPTTGLDPQSRRAIWDEIRAMRDRGTAVLLCSQQLDEADTLADRVAIIDRGRVVAEDSPGGLKRGLGGDLIELRLEDERSAQALAAALDGQVSARGETVRLTTPEGSERVPAVLGLAQERGLPVRSLSVTEPTLEDAFLTLTGRRIETEPDEAAP